MDIILWHAGIFLGIVLLVGLVAAAIIFWILQGAKRDVSVSKRLDLLEAIMWRKKRKLK